MESFGSVADEIGVVLVGVWNNCCIFPAYKKPKMGWTNHQVYSERIS